MAKKPKQKSRYTAEISSLLSAQINEEIWGIALLTRSPLVNDVEWAAKALKKDDANILITGETGTGKELFAKQIARSAGKKLLIVNCAAINPSLAESELFGHKKGAFSGAIEDRVGLLKSADNEILFLDEIGDLEPHMQAKLLRAIEQKKFHRVGDSSPTSHTALIIGATNNPDNLRPDLRWRFQIQIDSYPLRDRRQDIFVILHGWLKDKTNGAAGWRFNWQAFTGLMLSPLDGNVREVVSAAQQSLSISTERRGDIGFYYKPPASCPLHDSAFCLTVWQEIARNIRRSKRGRRLLPMDFGSGDFLRTYCIFHNGQPVLATSWSIEDILILLAELSDELPGFSIPEGFNLTLRLDVVAREFGGCFLSDSTLRSLSTNEGPRSAAPNFKSMSEKEVETQALSDYYTELYDHFGNRPTKIAEVAGVSSDTVAKRLKEYKIR